MSDQIDGSSRPNRTRPIIRIRSAPSEDYKRRAHLSSSCVSWSASLTTRTPNSVRFRNVRSRTPSRTCMHALACSAALGTPKPRWQAVGRQTK